MGNNTNDPLEEVDTVISSPEKPEEILNKEPEKKGLGKIISIVIVLVVIASGIFLWKSGYLTMPVTTTTDTDTILVIEPMELTIDMNNSAQMKAYLQGADENDRQDITDQVEWYSSDLGIFTIGNTSVKGQVTSRDKEGEAFITLMYGDQTEIIPVTIRRPQLEVECTARILKENYEVEYTETAKVGDTIQWVAMYNEIGAPKYSYKWTGTDGLDSDWAIAEKVYETPGLKEVNFFTEDTAGTTAETNCSITITN